MSNEWKEIFVEGKVTYILEVEGRVVVVENVPARVSLEIGERHFGPETVERLQEMIWEHKQPTRLIQAPVYEFSA